MSAALGLLIVVGAGADEVTRRLQEELRKRNLYFGDVDGRRTEEVQAALQRYQQRKGFAASGMPDADTLASLGIKGDQDGGSDHQPWPEAPVLKSDVARAVAAKDREFLEKVEEATPPPVAEPPAIARAPAGDLAGEKSARLPSGPLASRSPGLPQEPPPRSSAEAAKEADLARMVREYLAACESNDLAREMAYYADRMQYFDHGAVSREFVEKDVSRYYERWPQRKYELLSLREVTPETARNERTVLFRIRFALSGKTGSAKGQTDNIFKVRPTPEGLKFVVLKENRVLR